MILTSRIGFSRELLALMQRNEIIPLEHAITTAYRDNPAFCATGLPQAVPIRSNRFE